MKILLVYPNARKELIGWGDLGAIAEPLALEYLSAGVKPLGHEVRLLDLRLRPDALEATLRGFKPDVVGMTGYSMHVLRNLEIARMAKEICPNCVTVAGGHHATLMPEDFFEPQMDAVCVGEGVYALAGIVTRTAEGRELTGIPGVWARNGGTFELGGPEREFNINNLPLPDRSLTEADRGRYFIDWMKPIALVRTSVGCPYRCSFCSLWKIMDGLYHMRDPQQVVEELRAVPEPYVFLVDDEPFVNKRRMTELANAIERSGVKKKYFAYCRVDSLLRERDLMIQWRDIGLQRIFLGIEAITEKDLNEYNKRINLAQVEKALQSARELGIDVFAQFIVNTDFTEKDFKRLIRFVRRNKIAYPSFTILTPIPGTASMKSFEGILEMQSNGRPNWELFDLQYPVTRTALPRERFMEEYKNLHRVFMESYLNYRKRIAAQEQSVMMSYC